jgi:hypothetical protein
VQITEIDHPATVQVNQTLPISTHLTITCSPVNKYVVARVDVISNETSEIITSNSTGIGVIQVSNPPYTKTVNVTVFNAVKAPSEAVNWKLQIHAWVFTGQNVTANVSQLIQVQVVKPSATPTTSTELIQSGTISSTLANLGVVDTLGLVVALALLFSLIILVRRRKQKSATAKPVGGPQA